MNCIFTQIKKISFFLLFTHSLTSFAIPINALVAKTNNSIGFNIMRESVKLDNTLKNRFISPISAHIALSMALNGMNGKTRELFLQELGYSPNIDNAQINIQNSSLLQMLIRHPLSNGERTRLLSRGRLPTVFTIQNSAWTTDGTTTHEKYDFKPQYIKELNEYYQISQVSALDFKNPKSADVINAWVKDVTRGMIPKIMDEMTLRDLLWVLLNATYLEAQWSSPFHSQSSDTFHLSETENIETPTMYRKANTNLANSDFADVVELNFNDSSIKAYVVLPHTISDFTLLQNDKTGVWTETFWNSILSSFETTSVEIKMPKFKFKDEVLLKEDNALTQALHFNFLFKNTADFSRMDSSPQLPSQLSIVKQNTKIEWDEKGVKAAAATVVGGGHGGGHRPPSTPFQFIVDHPFYFAIYDKATETFLYLGQVVNPNKN